MSNKWQCGYCACVNAASDQRCINCDKTKDAEAKSIEIVAFLPEEKERIGEAIIAAQTESPADFGKQIMDAVRDRSNKAFMNTVVDRAREVAEHLNSLYIARDKVEKEIALFQKRLAAIEAGEFTILRDGRLKYNDIVLEY